MAADPQAQAQLAVRLADEFGFYVFPVDHPTATSRCTGIKTDTHDPNTCTERGKHPCCKWSKWSTTDRGLLVKSHYFGGRHAKNIGIDCGKSGLLVLDEDVYDELARFCADHHVTLPPTLVVRTGKGFHWYFRQPAGEQLRNREGAFRGYKMNVRGAGGLVVGPGSLHASGIVYAAVGAMREIAPVPTAIVEALKTCEVAANPNGGGAVAWWRATDPIEYPKRHEAMVAAAGWCRRMGLKRDEAVPTMRDVYDRLDLGDGKYTWEQCLGRLDDIYARYEAGYRLDVGDFPPGRDGPEGGNGKATRRLDVRRLVEVQPETVEHVWGGRLALGKLAAWAGDPGVGKSFTALSLAAKITTGQALPGEPDERRHTPGDVLVASYEDGAGDTIRPRADLLGADLERLHIIDGARDERGKLYPFGPADVPLLAAALDELPGTRLLIIDPVAAWVGAGVDAYRDNEVRAALEGLRRLAAEKRFAVLLIMHLRKSVANNALARFSGSGAYGQLVRSALLAGRNPDDENQCAVAHIKHNLSARQPTLGYRITNAGVEWLGAVDGLDGERLAGHDTDERSARAEAVDFLRLMLADGTRLVRDVQEEAKAVAISPKALRNAKELLGVISSKAGWGGGWQWSLPPAPEGAPKVPEGALENMGGTLGALGGTLGVFEEGATDDAPSNPPAVDTEGNAPGLPCAVCHRPTDERDEGGSPRHVGPRGCWGGR